MTRVFFGGVSFALFAWVALSVETPHQASPALGGPPLQLASR